MVNYFEIKTKYCTRDLSTTFIIYKVFFKKKKNGECILNILSNVTVKIIIEIKVF